ncbi:MAG: hypothetical protein P9L99_21110 [Candidatus Lernaella stagnicola]|nr:hypothetical protein [Candidatus Lernaella stagnicola]
MAAATAPSADLKVKIVEPLASRRETFFVLAAICVIVLLMALRFAAVGGDDKTQYIRPYQRLDSILSGKQRTLYQSMLASTEDVIELREREGQWPEAALLEIETVPPFDEKFLPPSLRGLTWTEHDGNSWVDYIGQDPNQDDQENITYILRVIDLHAEYHPHPHPGLDYDPNQKVAVQVWVFPQPARPYPGERLPEAGWWWVVGPNDPSLSPDAVQTTPGPSPNGGT